MTDRVLILDENDQQALQKILDMWPSAEAALLSAKLTVAPTVRDGWGPIRWIRTFLLRRRELHAYEAGCLAVLYNRQLMVHTFDAPRSVVEAYHRGVVDGRDQRDR